MTRFSFRSSLPLVVGFAACYSPNEPIGGDGTDDGSTGATIGTETSNTVGSATVATTAPTNTTDVTSATETDATDATDATQGTDATDSVDTSAGSTDEGGALCGNAQMDDGEACDDGDEINGNGCNNDCVESGTVLWDLGYGDSEDPGTGAGATDIGVNVDGVVVVTGATGSGGWIGTFTVDGMEVEQPVVLPGVQLSALDFFSGGDLAIGYFDAMGVSVRRMTTAGDIVWSTTALDTGGVLGSGGRGIDVDEDDNIVAVGAISESIYGGDIWTGEFDDAGFQGWSDVLDNVQPVAGFGRDVACAPDGECVAAGRIDGNGGPTAGGHYGWFRRFSPAGVTIWTRTFDEPSGSFDVGCVAVDVAGNALVIGTAASDIWVRKYEPGGDVEWTVTYDDPNSDDDWGDGCAADPDGNVIAVGWEMRDDLAQQRNAWIAKYDGEGTLLWMTTHNGVDNVDDAAVAVATDDAGRIYVAGRVDYDNLDGGAVKLWIRALAP